VTDTVAAALEDVDAVLIASSTPTHVDLMVASAAAGKPILCEKPIDLDIDRVNGARKSLADAAVPIQIAFNRRYDPSHRAVRDAIVAGEIGELEQVVITSRDTGLAPRAYLEVSGGIFRDMMIHDFDLARFLLDGDEIEEVFAVGSVRVDPMLTELGDVDTAMVVMRSAKSTLVHINNSRRSVYGHDQRVEVLGSNGMLQADHPRSNAMVRYDRSATTARGLLPFSFIDRFAQAYVDELDEFIQMVEGKKPPTVTYEDGRRALLLGNAATTSFREGRPVKVSYG
jgi:myo-inositol 2-dehydrogenase/D-chiro-inositol 1-dehydrogenase